MVRGMLFNKVSKWCDMMHRQRSANVFPAFGTVPLLLLDDHCARFTPCPTAVGSWTPNPKRRVLSFCVLGAVAVATNAAAEVLCSFAMLETPRLSFKDASASGAGQEQRRNPHAICRAIPGRRRNGVFFGTAPSRIQMMHSGPGRARARAVGPARASRDHLLKLSVASKAAKNCSGGAFVHTRLPASGMASGRAVCTSVLGLEGRGMKRFRAGPASQCGHGKNIPRFGGAATTSLVANRLGRRSIYIDLSTDYRELAAARLRDEAPLFADAA